ncbi:MAG: hypothetical protein LBG45_03610 [Dysgonamonadaceae bacterium]|nr:hypothetical protein [Dysgonamonadaceae bacterium]
MSIRIIRFICVLIDFQDSLNKVISNKNDYICKVEHLIFYFMLTRIQVFDTLEKMPEQFSVDQLFDKLLFIDKVETGLMQSKNGQINTKKEAKQKLSRWLK